MDREIVVYNGLTYARYPRSKSKSRARYFYPFKTKNADGSRKKALHQQIWIDANGPIPDRHHIHHVDGNPSNNALDNLRCFPSWRHTHVHVAGECSDERREHLDRVRPLTKEWHASGEGLEWHRQHGQDTWEGRRPEYDKACEECGKPFKSFFERARFCSRSCINRHNERTHRYYEERNCIICGKSFEVKKSKKQQTCSRSCGAEMRRRNRPRF